MFTLAPIINTKPEFLYSGEIFSGFDEYEGKLRVELAKGSIQNAQTADFFQGNAHVISQYIEGLKADLMREPLEDRRNRARALELQIYQLQVNGRAHGEHYDLGYLTQWKLENSQYSAFLKEVNKIYERKQSENGVLFATNYSHPELYYWLLANPSPSPYRTSVEKVYKEKVQDLRYCGEQHVIHNSFEVLEEWLRIHTGQSPFRDAVVSGLQGRYGAYTAEYVLVTLGAIQNWLYGNPHQSPFRYGIEQVFSRKQSEDGRRFGEVNILNHIWGWLQQNPDESPFRDSMKEVYREKIIVDLLGDDLTHSYDWWNNPDAQLEYFFELAEQLGNENLLKKAQQEREYFLSQVPMLRHTQQRFWEMAYPQDYRSPVKNIDDWRNQLKQDPYVGESYRKYCQELANYNAEVENAKRHAKRKKHRAIFRNIVGIGLGAFVSSLLPGLGSMVLTSVMRGAVFGAMSSAISRQNIAKGTFQGAFFAGVGNVVGQVMDKVAFLKEAERLQGVIKAGTIGALSAEINGGKTFQNMLVAIACQGVTQEFKNLTPYEQAFIKSTLATVLKGGDLGMALMASSMGMIESVVQNTGETLGNGVRNTIQETTIVQPTRLAITDGNSGDTQEGEYEDNLVLAYNEHSGEPQPMNFKERWQALEKNYQEREQQHYVEGSGLDAGDVADVAWEVFLIPGLKLLSNVTSIGTSYLRSKPLSEIQLVERTLNNQSRQITPQYNNHNANNANAQKALNKKMRALQDAQKDAVKTQELLDGRVRYFLEERPSKTLGITRGSSYVTEYNPNTGQVRSWIENYNHDGSINRVHPKMIDGQDIVGQHYPPTQKELQFFSKPMEKLK